MTGARAALFVHGAGGGGWEWNVWRGVFEAAGFHVEAPDLMPARSDVTATRLQDYQAQVRAALAALPRPRVLVGASLGGLLALNAAEFQVLGASLLLGLATAWGALHIFALADRDSRPKYYAMTRIVLIIAWLAALIGGTYWTLGRTA